MVDASSTDAPDLLQKRAGGWRGPALLIAKLAVSAGLLTFAYLKVQPTLHTLQAVDWWAVSLAVALLLLQPPVMTFRWRMILEALGGSAKLLQLLQVMWVSVLAGQFLLASVGSDLVRVLYVRTKGMSLGIAVSSVLIDRAIALVAIAILAVIFCPLLAGVGDMSILWITGGVAVMGIGAAPVLLMLVGPVQRLAQGRAWLMPIAKLLGYAAAFMRRPRLALGALGLALLVHALSVAALLVISRGLGIVIDPIHLVGVSVVITFAMVLPMSIGGWGVREAVAVTLLGFYGVPGDTAFLAAVLLGVSYTAASLPGGVIWVMRGKEAGTAGEAAPAGKGDGTRV